ncbi:MAG: metal-dependent hydrolase [Alphaproteobacteria bacterium]|nr:metal-dependent hydrolase [Alphaproteobacteria bacterium]
MADLVTHIATALIVKAVTRAPHTGVLVLGVVLPDLAARGPTVVFSRLSLWGASLPDWMVHGFGVLHMPLGFLALTLLVSLAFVPEDRGRAWGQLLAGCALHLGVDLLQFHVGVGYPLLYPFSTWHYELGWMGTEDSVTVAPWLFAASAAAWWWRRPQKGTAAVASGSAEGS